MQLSGENGPQTLSLHSSDTSACGHGRRNRRTEAKQMIAFPLRLRVFVFVFYFALKQKNEHSDERH